MSPTAFDHNKVLKQVAREVFEPYQLIQKGRSRIWLDDRRWHVIVVSFDPSGFSRGSYLVVSVMWLWVVKDFVSYDHGDRVGLFDDAREEDWDEVIRRKANAAVERVRELREELADLAAAADLLERDLDVGWPRVHAAIANGLLGRMDRARELLGAELSAEWAESWNDREPTLPRLRDLTADPAAFRQEIVRRIGETRRRQALPPLEDSAIEAALGKEG